MKRISLLFIVVLTSIFMHSSSSMDVNNQSFPCRVTPTCFGKINEPNRQQMINDLYKVYSHLAAGEYDMARKYFCIPADISEENIKSMFRKMIEEREISPAGIAVLEKLGNFGKLREIFPDRAAKWLDRAKLTSDTNCYAFSYNGCEIAGVWETDRFRFFRMDDLGKIAAQSN